MEILVNKSLNGIRAKIAAKRAELDKFNDLSIEDIFAANSADSGEGGGQRRRRKRRKEKLA